MEGWLCKFNGNIFWPKELTEQDLWNELLASAEKLSGRPISQEELRKVGYDVVRVTIEEKQNSEIQ